MPEASFSSAIRGSRVAWYVEFLSACSSSTRALQENILYNSMNTTSAAAISVYTTKAKG